MLVSWLMSVVSLDDLVHEWSEGVVGVVGSSVNSDTRVGPLGSGEDSLSEGESEFVSSVLALLPSLLVEAFHEERFGSSWEVWESLDVLWGLEVRTHHGSVELALSDGRSVLSTHWFFRL